MLAKAINRPALLAWSPNFDSSPIVACGTATKFKNNTGSRLELFDLSSEQPHELLSISVPSCFNRISWTSVEANRKELIVGAFNEGRLEVYDVQMLLNAESEGILSVPKLHSGPIKALDISRFQPNLLASGAINGEIALWDLDNIKKSSLISVKKSEKFTNTSDLSWNPRIPHVIAASSSAGVISIIDLRSKKEVSSFYLPQYVEVSSISWNPEIPTNIATGSCDDTHSNVYLWDLRAAASPQNIFQGHSRGISSVSWCQQDPGLILSSGRDSKVICWNPGNNDIIREYTCEDVFEARWCPKDPNIFALSSYTNGITFTSILDTTSVDHSSSIISPKWLNCPIGASFGGGNACSIFSASKNNVAVLKPKIEQFSNYYDDLLQFESNIKQLSLSETCKHLIKQEFNNERKSWLELISVLFASKPNNEMIELLKNLEIENISELSLSETYSDRENGSIITHISNSLEALLTDKIIQSDFEGAMLECIKMNRFVDAIIISDCGGEELREKSEDLIIKSEAPMYLRLAKSIRRRNFDDFVATAPINQWYKILEVVCIYAEPDAVNRLLKVLSERLISEGMHKFACYPLILSGDFEEFLDIILNHKYTLNLMTNSLNLVLEALIFDYKLLRILETYRSGLINSFEKSSNKILAFEISVKLRAIFISFGYKPCITDLVDSEFYAKNFKEINVDIDAFIGGHEAFFMKNLVTNDPNPGGLHSNQSNEFAISNAHLEFVPIIQRHLTSNPLPLNDFLAPSLQSPSIKYNDAPIINPKLLRLSSQIGPQELKVDIVNRALESIANAIDNKSIPENQSRLAKECFKKLVPNLICSKEYSDLSKQSIVALFKELASGTFESSSTLAANILASFFSETKEWILPLKRLIEIAKI